MSRSMWSGVISFGMVTIPVKLHTATESHNIAFHQLHEKCDTRIKEQRYCPHCKRVVEWEEIVKGYEYEKGKYITLTAEDFEKLPLPSKHTIDVASFVDKDEIDPIYFDTVYYIEVEDKTAQKPYKLLFNAMQSKNVIGVASITFRNKERLCALRPVNGALCLQTLLYNDEIKKTESTKPGSAKISTQETKMAESLITALKGKFEPDKFKDTYQDALKKMISAKLKGKELEPTVPSEPTNVTDLMSALRASVERAKGNKKDTSKPAAKSAAKPRKKRTSAA